MISKLQRRVIYVASFLFSSHYALLSYINAAFLTTEKGVAAGSVGFLYAAASIIAALLLIVTPKLFAKFGNKTFLTSTLSLSIVALVGLVLFNGIIPALASFVIYLSIITITYFALDLILEHYSSDESTGDTRGTYLTLINIAWLLLPMLSAFLIGQGVDFNTIITIGLALTALSLTTVLIGLRRYKFKLTRSGSYFHIIKNFWHVKALRLVFIVSFTLQFFFAIMTIYLPLFLIQNVGLTWVEISFILPIMLLPFALTEKRIGKLADEKYGEKEFIISGIMVLALATASLSFITSTDWWVWAIVLFTTRVGAAAIEISTESYFFKHIDDKQASLVAMYREATPLAYIVAPVLASIFLTTFNMPFKYLWLLVAAIVIFSIQAAKKIKDTK